MRCAEVRVNRRTVLLLTLITLGLVAVGLVTTLSDPYAPDPSSAPEADPEPAMAPGEPVTVEEPPPLRAGLTGRVLSAAGDPLPSARVRAYLLADDRFIAHPDSAPAATATTDPHGAFSLGELPPGPYTLQARRDVEVGYLAFVEVAADAGQEVTIRMLPVATISGRVVSEANEPIRGATVTTDAGATLRGFIAIP
jgi:hypothetical protein